MVLRWLTGFFYKDNPGALGILSKKKYHWLPVLARLLAPTPDRRPKTYSDLVKQLKPIANGRAASTRPPQSTDEQKAKKKRNKTRENIIAAVAGLFIVAVVAAGGYFAWQYVEKKGAERDRQYAALKQQIAADKAAAEKKEAEEKAEAERKAAEEKRIAAEKEAARKAKIAERERLEAARTKIEKQDPSTLAVRETPKPAEVKSEPEKPKEEFIVVKDETPEEDTKDYGPIPDKKYTWLKGGNAKFPQEVKFQLANGAEIELIPITAGEIFVSTPWWIEGPLRSKIVITRPFWVTKFCVTAREFREYDETAVVDCVPIERAVGISYPVSKKLTRRQLEELCKLLTNKYRRQIPKGYVFRFPSAGEWYRVLSRDEDNRRFGDWWHTALYAGSGSKQTMEKLRKEKHLDAVCKWRTDGDGGWTEINQIFVGGRNRAMVTGVCDPCSDSQQMILDSLHPKNGYEEMIDPLFHNEQDGKAYYSVLSMIWDGCSFENKNPNFTAVNHIVLAPDLIREKAWNNAKTKFPHAIVQKLPSQNSRFNPKDVPSKISRPKEVRLSMVSKQDMVFCAVPKVKTFYMSNPEGQGKLNHKVELTYPFWISKYCVTVNQLREFGKYEGEFYELKEVERRFPKFPLCPSRCKSKWIAFCKFLNERYHCVLPVGYVFRLPTEAEYEWAAIGNKDGNIRNMDWERYFPNDDDFERMWKKQRMPSDVRCVRDGGFGGFCLGGRRRPNVFGVCDMIASGWGNEIIVLDTYDASWYVKDNAKDQWDIEWNVNNPAQYMVYEDQETDPLHYAGRLATRMVRRNGYFRNLVNKNNWTGCAHIVIGPDLEKREVEKEAMPYERNKFGGVLLDKFARISAMSSQARDGGQRFNDADNHKLLLSNESVIGKLFDGEECKFWDGCRTEPEDAPWIEVELDRSHQITGIQIDVFRNRNWVLHPRIWMSEDHKRWVEVFKDDRELGRYVADFTRRMVKAKWIRVGREPGYRNYRFVLSKLLIYGKEK